MTSVSFLEDMGKLRPAISAGDETDQLEFTGERFLPGYVDGSIELQHVHRYAFSLPFVKDRSVLDIACGEGYGSELMSQVARTVIGIDIDEATIALARRRYHRGNLSFLVGSAPAIPLKSGSVDVITCFETIEHIRDQDSFWSELKRVTNPAGVLIISSPNRDVYNQNRNTQNPFHVRELSREELANELSRRFQFHQILSQSVVFGSSILPVCPQPISQTVISLEPSTRMLAWNTGDKIRAPYSLAIASDQAVPSVGQSLYAGHYPPNAMSSLQGGISERDELARGLKQELAGVEADSRASIAEAQQKTKDALLAAKQAEEHFLEQIRTLEEQRDQAMLREARVRETLSEQDSVIAALKAMVGNRSRGRRSPGSGN